MLVLGSIFGLNGQQWSWWRWASWAGAGLVLIVAVLASTGRRTSGARGSGGRIFGCSARCRERRPNGSSLQRSVQGRPLLAARTCLICLRRTGARCSQRRVMARSQSSHLTCPVGGTVNEHRPQATCSYPWWSICSASARSTTWRALSFFSQVRYAIGSALPPR